MRYCTSVPTMTAGIGGQPEMWMIGLSLTTSDTATAPVGFGFAIGMPPKAAQLPTATTAAQPEAASLSISRWLTPAMVP